MMLATAPACAYTLTHNELFNENLIYTLSGLHITHSIAFVCLLACACMWVHFFPSFIWHEKRAKGSHFIFVALLSIFLRFHSLCFCAVSSLPLPSFVSFHHFTFAVHSHKCTLKLISRSLSVVHNIPTVFIHFIACSGIGKVD